MGRATNGLALPITGHDSAYGDWWQVTDDQQTGWVYAALVRAAGPLDQVPLVVAPLLAANAQDFTSSIAITVTKSLTDTQQAITKPYLSH